MGKTEKRIIEILRFRAPNSVADIIIYDSLKDLKQDQIDESLSKLLEKNIIAEMEKINRSFKLTNYDSAFIRETIKLGDKEIPRLINGNQSRIEDINYAMESLAEYADKLETKFEKKLNKQIQTYWLSIVTIFGVFIALFSFIIKISNHEISSENSFWVTIGIGFANLIPLIVLLVIMLLTIRMLFTFKEK